MITVVTPVFNQAHLTERCFGSLLQGSRIARELIVIDNHSTDRTPDLLLQLKAQFENAGWRFEIIRNDENQGFGRACNQGIRKASGDYVAVLNNDTWLMPGWDEALLSSAQELQADMVGPYFDERPYEDGRMLARAEKFVRRNRKRSIREWVSILMFFPKATLDRVGLFDERFFVTYEDTDLRHRMDLAGMRYFKTGSCYIWHSSKGTREQEALPSGYEQEGLRLFLEKWGFDPRARDHTRIGRLRRRFARIRESLGYI